MEMGKGSTPQYYWSGDSILTAPVSWFPRALILELLQK